MLLFGFLSLSPMRIELNLLFYLSIEKCIYLGRLVSAKIRIFTLYSVVPQWWKYWTVFLYLNKCFRFINELFLMQISPIPTWLKKLKLNADYTNSRITDLLDTHYTLITCGRLFCGWMGLYITPSLIGSHISPTFTWRALL